MEFTCWKYQYSSDQVGHTTGRKKERSTMEGKCAWDKSMGHCPQRSYDWEKAYSLEVI